MNRGSYPGILETPLDGSASMRPRFMNRGSVQEVKRSIQMVIASMRPRFMNRGSPSVRFHDALASGRFNEAPIHESGKSMYPTSELPRLAASMRPRFMNRGSTPFFRVVGRARFASMRPRFMNRGSVALRHMVRHMPKCFNEAPIHESGKSRRPRQSSRR